MRRLSSFLRAFHAQRPSRSRPSLGRNRVRTAATATVSELESRTLFANVGLEIPVLTYHKEEVLEVDATNGFTAQLNYLQSKGMQTITLQEYKAFRDTGSLPSGVSHPVVLVFDDATDDQITTAAPALQSRGFRGVAAIPTASVDAETNGANTATMKWSQINQLISTYDWDVASHSVQHDFMGGGKAGNLQPLGKFSNTDAALVSELQDSRDRIAYVTGRTPSAFIHPFDDVTARSVLLAADYYPMVFGEGSFYNTGAGNTPSTAQYVGRPTTTNDLVNGRLRRIAISTDTTIGAFKSMVDVAYNSASSTTQFSPEAIQPKTFYLATDGSVVVTGALNLDGTGKSDDITVNGTSFTMNGSTFSSSQIASSSSYSSAPSIVRFNVHGANGNDEITIIASPASSDTVANATIIAGGAGADTLAGSSKRDSINGGSGNDYITGGSGDDTLIGGSGTDSLYGEGGQDTYYSQDSQVDTIQYRPAEDILGNKDTNDLVVT